jgi:ElaB/YqjD/DUF883 family membrane-anchored ribosome-binding protein
VEKMQNDIGFPETETDDSTRRVQVKEIASQAGDFIRRQADRGSKELGGRLRAAADELESTGDDMYVHGQDITAALARQLAQLARRAGRYLESTDSRRMLEDARSFAREQPWAVVAAGVMAGFALSRFLKHTSPYDSRRDR